MAKKVDQYTPGKMFDMDMLMRVFRFNGSLNDPNPNRPFLPRFTTVIFNSSLIFMAGVGVFFSPMFIYHNIDNFSSVIQSFSNIVNSVLVLEYFLVVYLQSDKVNDLYEELVAVDKFSRPNDEVASEVYNHGQKLSYQFYKVSKYAFYITSFLGAIGCTDTYLRKDFETRTKTWFPFDLHKNGIDIVLMIEVYFGTVTITGHVFALTTMINCSLLQVETQLKILNLKFRNIRAQVEEAICSSNGPTLIMESDDRLKNDNENRFEDNECKVDMDLCRVYGAKLTREGKQNRRKRIRGAENLFPKELEPIKREETDKLMECLLNDCIAHHCAILSFIGNFESVWGRMFKMHLGVGLTESVVVLASSAMSEGTPRTTTLFLSFMCLAIYAVLSGFCFLSQKVTNESEKLQEAVYSCDWTDATKSFKKSLAIVISVTNQQSEIKVAGFVPLSMETLKNVIEEGRKSNCFESRNVLNSAYSYYMVMSSF